MNWGCPTALLWLGDSLPIYLVVLDFFGFNFEFKYLLSLIFYYVFFWSIFILMYRFIFLRENLQNWKKGLIAGFIMSALYLASFFIFHFSNNYISSDFFNILRAPVFFLILVFSFLRHSPHENILVIASILFYLSFFTFFGWLHDKVKGRVGRIILWVSLAILFFFLNGFSLLVMASCLG